MKRHRILLFQPDNPIRFIRKHLLDNYPRACRLEEDVNNGGSNGSQIDLTGESKEDSDDDELSDDEMPPETPDSAEAEESKQRKEMEQVMMRHGKYVRLLKGMPMFNPKARRHAVVASRESGSRMFWPMGAVMTTFIGLMPERYSRISS